jgi:predicted amidohydrolase
MKIAIYQCEGVPASKEDNLDILHRTAIKAADQGAGLLIFPEMFLTGYNIGDRIYNLAEPMDGPAAQKVAAMAREANVALLYGYPERSGELVYNSALLIDGSGSTLANYRKTHLFGSEEKRLFQPGESFLLTELEGLKIGILICYDVEFPEAVRALVHAGAELIAVPTANMEPYCQSMQFIIPARAFENQVFIAYANRCGHEADLNYCGLSCIVGPDGKELMLAGAVEGLFVAQINGADLTTSRRKYPYLKCLRSALYQKPVWKKFGDID